MPTAVDIGTGADTGAEADPARRGRPRDPDADAAILSATVEALAEAGMAGLSMDLVARRAGVGKSTIYRRWASKEELVLDALRTAPVLPSPDTGSLRGDLLAHAAVVVEKFSAQATSDVLPHLIAAACYDERLAESLADFNRSRQAPLRRILDRARTRGELATDVDRQVLTEVILGAFYIRRLITTKAFDLAFVTKVVDTVMRSITA